MAITLALRTDPGREVTIQGSTVSCCLCAFPQPGPSTLIFTQFLDAAVVQEVTRPIPADVGKVQPDWLLGQEPPFGTRVHPYYHTISVLFTLLPPGAGVDSFRLRLMDGETVVFDEGPFVY